MASPDLSTRQLRAFLALADLRHFTRAAEACHLSQPAFSTLVRALEESVGTRLFDRNTRSVQLTPEGRLFEPSARRLLADMGRALADLGDHVERRKGRVHVAALPSLAAGWLPALFAEFRQTWPGIELALSDQLSDACIDLVRGGQADFALASGSTRVADAAELRMRVLCTDRFHLVCRADHPLASEPRLTLRKLAPWPFIHMTRNSSVRQALEAALHPLAMNTVLEVEQLATVMGMVEAGLGISVVPTLTLYQFRRETIATRPLPMPQLTRRIYLVQRREGSLSAAARALHDMVVARLGSLSV
ncbi:MULTISPECIES: LysR family transcriptional regulator [unclassified Variovorax]|uniref:LysR family transcriptional regulator n=1 Tax=unclassified Variovorax TaxID=663243 RepID=UPI000880A1DC|nr:LysR family transcriptional regulator [Variovorax sp. CF079]SDD56875.1 DNA-binding transcriptional regulator, LysR family [Variovorax sp. CF079]